MGCALQEVFSLSLQSLDDAFDVLGSVPRADQGGLARTDDDEVALVELRKGIEWLEQDLSNVGPTSDDAENVAAYDAVARKQLDEA